MITVHPISNMGELVRVMVLGAEGRPERRPRNVGDHTITYGYGYTFIQRRKDGTWFITTTLASDLAAIGITMTNDPNVSNDEMDQLNYIVNALNQNNLTQADTLITQFIQNWRYVDLTDTKAQTLYNQVIGRKDDEIETQFRTVLGTTNGNYLFQALQDTQEMAVLLDMAYNGGAGLIGSKLVNAMWNGNRAEAWFEIRYNSNKENQRLDILQGLAKRRYLESEIFGLYNDPEGSGVDLNEAKQIYQMFQKNRKQIYDYENKYGQRFDGTDGTRNMITIGNNDANYQQVMNASGLTEIETITEALDTAKLVLLEDLRTRYSDFANNLQDDAIKAVNIYMNPSKPGDTTPVILDAVPYETTSGGENDVMIGNDNNDTIIGGKGNDVLIGEGDDDYLDGGKGDDILIGGAGFDTYYYHAGDGSDWIEDTGENNIIIEDNDGTIQIIRTAFKTGANIWTTPNGKYDLTINSPLKIVMPDGGSIQLTGDFQDGDFGIQSKNDLILRRAA
jgi:Ca2+-binding RTX toxin-like protein